MDKFENLSKEISNDKVIFTFEDELFYNCGGIWRASDRDSHWLYGLQSVIEKDIGQKLMYRGVRGDQLDQVLESGIDIPGKGEGDRTFATMYLEKSSEYGQDHRKGLIIWGNAILNDVCVILYERDGLEREKDSYKCTYLKDPLDILVGALMFKNISTAERHPRYR